jgi:hypothetical protein
VCGWTLMQRELAMHLPYNHALFAHDYAGSEAPHAVTCCRVPHICSQCTGGGGGADLGRAT